MPSSPPSVKQFSVPYHFFVRQTVEVAMRRSVLALFASLTLLVPAGLPDSKIEVKDLQNHPFAVDFPSGGKLRMHLRSGEFRIVGRNDNRIAVHFRGRNADNARDLTVRLQRRDHYADLRVIA